MLSIVIIYIISYLVLNKKQYQLIARIFSTINAIQCVVGCLGLELGEYIDLNYSGGDDLIHTLQIFYVYLFTDGIFNLITSSFSLANILHHFVGGVGIYLMTKQRIGLGLGIYFAFTEISTPLLNVAWWFYVNKIDNIMSKSVFVLFWLVFGLSRILTIPLLWYYIEFNQVIISELTTVNWFMVYGGSFTLVSLNIVWFVMLTKKIFYS